MLLFDIMCVVEYESISYRRRFGSCMYTQFQETVTLLISEVASTPFVRALFVELTYFHQQI
jgi:hypothetical protein